MRDLFSTLIVTLLGVLLANIYLCIFVLIKPNGYAVKKTRDVIV